MASLSSVVNKCLDKMHVTGGMGKGEYGEEAIFKICESLYQTQGGILYHSYTYKTNPDKAGNIKVSPQGNLMIENLGNSTEIDILYVTKYRVFPIEVKAYKAKEIILTDDRISGCYKVDKSPIHQNEMHCRHLYPWIYQCLPNGESDYILPIVVFVDKCKLRDQRSDWQKSYVYKSILDTFLKTIVALNAPGDKALNLIGLDKCLTEALVSYKVKLPLRT